MKKSEKLNKNIELEVGMEVKDLCGNKGIIVKIKLWEGNITEENHGTISYGKAKEITMV